MAAHPKSIGTVPWAEGSPGSTVKPRLPVSQLAIVVVWAFG
jgi:hypothetical protein